MNGLGIAVYGKGGIGKSTVSANLAYTLAHGGSDVILVGCDPKHDTTRQIVDGDIRTVTDYVVSVPPSERKLEDVAVRGAEGVLCVEAGGPRPGVGCAGKGIVTMFQTLERLGLGSVESDFIVYDVLGDVICGGFAVPMRPSHSDAVLVVTSGEPMSIYAANNILRGSIGFEKGRGRVTGMVLNRRGTEGEDDLVSEFSRAVRVPVLITLDRSDRFVTAERNRTPVSRMFPESAEAEAFRRLADIVRGLNRDDLHSPLPLTDSQMDELLTCGHVEGTGRYREEWAVPVRSTPVASAPAARSMRSGPMGAILAAGRVCDIPVVVHSTSACCTSLLGELLSARVSRDPSYPVGSGDNVVCTDMGLKGTIFGGAEALSSVLESAIESTDGPVIVVTGCLPGMMGDDLAGTVDLVRSRHPDRTVMLVESNRSEAGHDARSDVLSALADLMDPSMRPDMGIVAVIDDSFDELERGENLRRMDSLICGMGLRRIPGITEDCTLADIENLGEAGTVILGSTGPRNEALRRVLESKGMRFLSEPVPRGMSATLRWLDAIGSRIGNESRAGSLKDEIVSAYRTALGKYPLGNRRVTLIPARETDFGWIVETLEDAGATVTVMRPGDTGWTGLVSDLESARPDLAIGDGSCLHGYTGLRIPVPETSVSHVASIRLLRRAYNALQSDRTLAWRLWGDV